MQHKKILDFIGTILLFIGMFLAFLPHALHVKSGLDESTSHLRHAITGIILVVTALGILIFNNKALNIPKKLQKHLNQ
ncbi:hypothetical protein HYY71_01650 [Candidatus Woesearchaeota archaeon]|nr:hypothetical protein [Candidatus Woesearchaeota archaeon]